MKQLLLLTTAFGLATTLSLPAVAGGFEDPVIETPTIVPNTPPLPARYDWTGFSIGGQLSFGDVNTDGPELDGEDALYGFRAYYDYDFGNFIAGGGLQYDAADIDLDGVAAIESVLRLGGRVGVGSGQNWYYGTAGFARADTDAGAADPGSSNGYFIGAGYEVALSDTFTIGAEILYHEFDDFDIDTLEAEATTIGLSANYRF
ncbi:outer membrane protein [Shimia ponticola]|uniref:outer membrane protein n=1 Tax=Shimia ponticola TaxID=2582893 RepID=UPI0011BFD850|nr:outer membrane beta-barrel protein [Shimia ponticola]